jgi:hypothetical protein
MQMTRMEQGAYFSVSAKSSDEFNTALMGWIPEKSGRWRALQKSSEKWTRHNLCDQDRLLRAVGNDLEDMHYTKATEPERVGSPNTQLLTPVGRKREWV